MDNKGISILFIIISLVLLAALVAYKHQPKVNVEIHNTPDIYKIGSIYCIEFTQRKLINISVESRIRLHTQWITMFDEFGKAKTC